MQKQAAYTLIVIALLVGCYANTTPVVEGGIAYDSHPGTRAPTATVYLRKQAVMGYCKTNKERIPLKGVRLVLTCEHGELARVSDLDGRFGFVIDEAQKFTLQVAPPTGWVWHGMTYDRFWDDWVLWFVRPGDYEAYRLPEKSDIGTYALPLGETWYLPDIWNKAKHPPTVDPALYPPGTYTPWPTKTATATSTPTPTMTGTPWPTKTRIPWPEGEVPGEVPYEVWLNVLEMTRSARGIEGWFEVFEDPLIILAGNNDYGAQLSPIVTFHDANGQAWRGMETCEGLLIETPDNWVWILKGYTGPVVLVWPRTYN